MTIPKKVAERLLKNLPTFQKVLADAKNRDVNESDTVTIVVDMLSSIFGYDKYTEITSEQAIRGTFCDLAVRLDGKIKFLIEVKAIGLALKENHLRQACGYGANQGIQWIVLTNGITWEIHRLHFEQPISNELICSIDFAALSARKASDHDALFLLCKEGIVKSVIETFHERSQVINRFVVAAVLQSEPVQGVLRRELKRLAPDVKIGDDELGRLTADVLKRDAVEGEQAVAAKRRLAKSSGKLLRKSTPSKVAQTIALSTAAIVTESTGAVEGEPTA